MFLYHGSVDWVVNEINAKRMHEELERAGVKAGRALHRSWCWPYRGLFQSRRDGCRSRVPDFENCAEAYGTRATAHASIRTAPALRAARANASSVVPVRHHIVE